MQRLEFPRERGRKRKCKEPKDRERLTMMMMMMMIQNPIIPPMPINWMRYVRLSVHMAGIR
jgi:hypothetical protein